MTKKYESKKKVAQSDIESEVLLNREAAIAEETLRHQKALESIESEFDEMLEQRLTEVTETIDQEMTAESNRKFKHETAILEKILQGKTAELTMRQAALNEGLHDNFAKSLKSFNQMQTNVIEELHQIPKDKKAVNLSDYRQSVAG